MAAVGGAGRSTRAAAGAAGATTDVAQMRSLLKKLDDDAFVVAADAKFLNEANSEDLVAAFKGIDNNKLASIGEQMDPKTIDALKKVEGGADLAKKLDPSSVQPAKKLTRFQQAKNAAAAFTKAFSAKLNKATKSIKKTRSTAKNPPKDIGDVKRMSKKIKPKKQADDLARETAANLDDAGEAVTDTTKVLEDGSKSSKSLKKALGELGITPGSVAIGAGVIVLLCMAYDTDNPFTAVDRALDDTGKVVKGFKEVADSAATAAKDVTTGGFDFISFVTNNSWISFSCSILCVILLFALFMMGMLGSMGGGNNKGR